MSLVVISYSLKSLKISYANGCVSVRIFYENNLISFLSTHATHAYALTLVAASEPRATERNFGPGVTVGQTGSGCGRQSACTEGY
jgi:hypothetical protein